MSVAEVVERPETVGDNSTAPASAAGQANTTDPHLESANRKIEAMLDLVRGVICGSLTGVYIFGPGGIGKTHHTLEELRHSGRQFQPYNSKITGKGLYESLKRAPNAIHVLEDMETLLYDGAALGVLRSALWGTTSSPTTAAGVRTCTWTTSRVPDSFDFSGGIIFTANRAMAGRRGEVEAVRTRIPTIEMEFTSHEIWSVLKSVASNGYGEAPVGMPPEECLEVFHKLREICTRAGRSPDIRLLINSFEMHRSWNDNRSSCHWADVIATLVNEKVSSIASVRTRGQRETQKENELELVRGIRTLSREERIPRWEAATGKKENAFYRRLRELEAIEQLASVPSPVPEVATTEDVALEILDQVLAVRDDTAEQISEATSVATTDSGNAEISSAA